MLLSDEPQPETTLEQVNFSVLINPTQLRQVLESRNDLINKLDSAHI